MFRAAAYLLERDVFEPGQVHCALSIFQVLKKNGKARLVMNAKPVNEFFKSPPNMELPSIHEVIDFVLSNEVAATADARAFFYQLPLPPLLRRYFGVRVPTASRGRSFDTFEFKKIPMGWSWAPAIGQAVSSNILAFFFFSLKDNSCLAPCPRSARAARFARICARLLLSLREKKKKARILCFGSFTKD